MKLPGFALLLALSFLPAMAHAAGVQVLMAGEAKDDLAPVLKLAEAAEQRLWVFAYTLSDKALVKALAAKARQPGFDLRVLIDAEQYAKSKSKLQALEDRITLITVPAGGRMHVKLLLVDDHTLVAGSKNWSHLPSLTKWNDLVVVRDSKLVAQVAQDFDRVAGSRATGGRAKGRSKSPSRGSARVAAHFCAPGELGTRVRAEILSMIKGAKKRIRIGMFVLNDPSLAKAVWQQRRKGVEVKVVLDAVQHANLKRRKDRSAKTLLGYLEGLGGDLRLCHGKQVHHKFAVIDDSVVTGSANWSKAAWGKNHEVVLILRREKKASSPRFLDEYVKRHEVLWQASK